MLITKPTFECGLKNILARSSIKIINYPKVQDIGEEISFGYIKIYKKLNRTAYHLAGGIAQLISQLPLMLGTWVRIPWGPDSDHTNA